MSRIRGKGTKPELAVRKMIHGMGFHYRLHRKGLPERSVLVFPGLKKVIFVHGCLWRMHNCRYGRTKPSTNQDFWENKRQTTRARDAGNIKELKKME
jgi:DNA mismatch endonuclease (patch repair protein)